jgi:hypothetical protein
MIEYFRVPDNNNLAGTGRSILDKINGTISSGEWIDIAIGHDVDGAV